MDLHNQLDRSAGVAVDNVGDGDAHARAVADRPLKLPAFPVFQGGDKAEEATRWLEKLGKHAELQHWSIRDTLLHLSCSEISQTPCHQPNFCAGDRNRVRV